MKMNITLSEKRKLGIISQMANPNVSYCKRCWLTWSLETSGRTVMTSDDGGTFAVCTDCWKEASLEELKAYFTSTYLAQLKSVYHTEYKMEHTLEHLIECVEKEKNVIF